MRRVERGHHPHAAARMRGRGCPALATVHRARRAAHGRPLRTRHECRRRGRRPTRRCNGRSVDSADRCLRLRVPARSPVRPPRGACPARPGAAHVRRCGLGALRGVGGGVARSADRHRRGQGARRVPGRPALHAPGSERARSAPDFQLLASRPAHRRRPRAPPALERGTARSQSPHAQAPAERTRRVDACPTRRHLARPRRGGRGRHARRQAREWPPIQGRAPRPVCAP